MKSKCHAKGARLCYFDEICPQGGPDKAPTGGQQASGDMWAPIQTSATDTSPNWVQIGGRDGGMCNKLSNVHAVDRAGWWMITNNVVAHKEIYACCPVGKKESIGGFIMILFIWDGYAP